MEDREPVCVTQLVLLLGEVPGVGDRTLAGILRRNAVLRRAPEAFLRLTARQLMEEYGLRRESAAALTTDREGLLKRSAATARELRRRGVSLVTQLDAIYPERLLQGLDDPPAVLFAYGNCALLSLRLFALATSNGASDAALAAGDCAAAAAIELGWSPVTGHNRPGYQRPALVARRTGGRICYVLDRGLYEAFGGDLSRELFPAARIWSPLYDPASDLTLSPFGLWEHGIALNNRRRDAVLFALADAIFVSHARPGGQMEAVCLRALDRGRPVFLVGPAAQEDSSLRTAGAVALDVCDRHAVEIALGACVRRTTEE